MSVNLNNNNCTTKFNKDMHGLCSNEVFENREKYGSNVVPEPQKETYFDLFMEQVSDPANTGLLLCSVIYIIAGEIKGLINGFLLTGTISFALFQKYKTEESEKQMQKIIKTEILVKRDNQTKSILAEELVIDDICIVSADSPCCADGILLTNHPITVSEKHLTGESTEIKKKQGDIIFADSPIMFGKGTIKITAIGKNTKIGETTNQLRNIEKNKAPLTESMDMLLKLFVKASIILSLLVFIIGMIFGQVSDDEQILKNVHFDNPTYNIIFDKLQDAFSWFCIGIGLFVAVVPEGLRLFVETALAIGQRTLSASNVLVKKSTAVIDAGYIEYLITDKTATITTGKLSVNELFVNGFSKLYNNNQELLKSENICLFDNFSSVETLQIFTACLLICKYCTNVDISENGKASGNPTDIAIYDFVTKFNIKIMTPPITYESYPFSSTTKMMFTIVKISENHSMILVKGAPSFVLKASTSMNSRVNKSEIENKINFYERYSQRCIGLAYKNVYSNIDLSDSDKFNELIYSNLTFCGILSISDPPRSDIRDTVNKLTNNGITTIIASGDSINTTVSIARAVEIVDDSTYIGCYEFLDGSDKDPNINKIIEKQIMVCNCRIFARCTSFHKLLIIQYLQNRGAVVGMVGDGVNDSPAIAQSNLGVAMYSGTSAAKQNASIVLLDDKMSSITIAIEEAKRLYSNIQKLTIHLVSTNPAEIFVVILCIMFRLPSIMNETGALVVNVSTDITIPLALIMSKTLTSTNKPLNKNVQILTPELIKLCIFDNIILTLIVFLSYVWAIKNNSLLSLNVSNTNKNFNVAQVFARSILTFSQYFRAFGCMDLNNTFNIKYAFSNVYLNITIATSLLFTFLIENFKPIMEMQNSEYLNWKAWSLIIIISILPTFFEDLYKKYV